MSRYIIVAAVTLVLLGIGFYLYSNSQTGTNEPQQNGEHGSAAGGHQQVVQSHRSYEIEATSDTKNVRPNQPTKFSYKIKNDKGEILKNYETVHEKIMHFIVVRSDLQYFQHLHPNFNQRTGEFTVDITFPTDGAYRVFPDFTPAEDNPQKLPVTVFHDISVGDKDKYKAQPVVPDTESTKTVGDYQITYTFSTTYSLTIKQNGKPVTDLENYLGALGHSVILKMDTLDFIHTHAEEINTKGPEIKFAASLPESGIYKIFTQFQHQGKVFTVEYAIKVK